ncbi:hypothetical protein SAMN06269185_3285 [Natronoarchaeum philippinense]|uniref:Uncharacterized protein n=1 Tax=Natronoarchaeum philippinense TaxID=558529 RepID=A0A285PAA8_NATPI|nr:hypothetical protein [Natronoarchaeum philippinense]SNZ18187.1 hypothetical protein SAMN06269185_3285 [Natronoarchaeum philippinense]
MPDFTRRRALEVLGTGATTVLAGCSGDPTNTEDKPNETAPPEPEEQSVGDLEDVLVIEAAQQHTLRADSGEVYDAVEIHADGALAFEDGAALQLRGTNDS